MTKVCQKVVEINHGQRLKGDRKWKLKLELGSSNTVGG
jgi:hypothetical protein